MTGMPSERVIVNLEHEFDLRKKTEKRCDRLLFFIHPAKNNLVAASIELKSGKAVESDVIEKLENSLNFTAPNRTSFNACHKLPISLFYSTGRGIKWTNPKGTKQPEVSVHGRAFANTDRGRCGRPRNLAGVLFG